MAIKDIDEIWKQKQACDALARTVAEADFLFNQFPVAHDDGVVPKPFESAWRPPRDAVVANILHALLSTRTPNHVVEMELVQDVEWIDITTANDRWQKSIPGRRRPCQATLTFENVTGDFLVLLYRRLACGEHEPWIIPVPELNADLVLTTIMSVDRPTASIYWNNGRRAVVRAVVAEINQ